MTKATSSQSTSLSGNQAGVGELNTPASGPGMPLVANNTGSRAASTAEEQGQAPKTRSVRRPPSTQALVGSLQDLSLGQSSKSRNRPWTEASTSNSNVPWSPQDRDGHLQGPYGAMQIHNNQIPPHQMQQYWVPYMNNMYQYYGDQRGAMLPQGPYAGMMPYHHMMYPGSREAMNPHLAGNQMYAQSSFGRPYVPLMQSQSVRGRPPRSTKTPLEAPETYEFDMEEATGSPESARKTLMLRNIPNKYSIHMLLEMLNQCHRRPAGELVYDFCYLPIDFKNRCNLGYAFVNFTNAESTIDCYKAFHNKRWNDFNSKKVCEVKYARVQGQEALVDHFRNSKFPINDVDSLPLLFEKSTQANGEEVIRSLPLHSRQSA